MTQIPAKFPKMLKQFSSLLLRASSKTKTKQNKTKQNKTKQNKTKQNKTKQNKTKQQQQKQTKTKTKKQKQKTHQFFKLLYTPFPSTRWTSISIYLTYEGTKFTLRELSFSSEGGPKFTISRRQ